MTLRIGIAYRIPNTKKNLLILLLGAPNKLVE
jgi:hypothetical protein